METVDDPIGEKYPAGSQVTSRVPRAHVAKVDHTAEKAPDKMLWMFRIVFAVIGLHTYGLHPARLQS